MYLSHPTIKAFSRAVTASACFIAAFTNTHRLITTQTFNIKPNSNPIIPRLVAFFKRCSIWASSINIFTGATSRTPYLVLNLARPGAIFVSTLLTYFSDISSTPFVIRFSTNGRKPELFHHLWMVVCNMTARVFAKFKVLYSVIPRIMVDMMNYFFSCQKSPNMFFHNKAMLGNITLFLRARMLWHTKVPIPASVYSSSLHSSSVPTFAH
jgi:hypothetical protein